MIVDENLLEELENSVSNSQYRLANVHVLSILEQLIPAIEELKEKMDIIEDFLSSDEDEKQPTAVVEEKKVAVEEKIAEPKIDTLEVKEDVESKEVKAKAKTKE
jgi:hypothetical protein